jgi:hypothetical protein
MPQRPHPEGIQSKPVNYVNNLEETFFSSRPVLVGLWRKRIMAGSLRIVE